MKTQRFDVTSFLVSSIRNDIVLRLHKRGAIRFTHKSQGFLKIKESHRIAFYQGEENSKAWYFTIEDANSTGFIIHWKANQSITIHSIGLVKKIFESFDYHGKSMIFRIIKSDRKINNKPTFRLLYDQPNDCTHTTRECLNPDCHNRVPRDNKTWYCSKECFEKAVPTKHE